MSGPTRVFRYDPAGGQFYSPMNGATWTGPYLKFGIERTGAEDLPERPLYDVRFVEPGDGGPSNEPGQTWQQRAFVAEMAAASQRVTIGELERQLAQAERARDGAIAQAERPILRAQTLLEGMHRMLVEIARMAAEAYDCEADYADLIKPPHYDEGWQPSAEELYEFIAETLRHDHPSVRYPVPTPDVVARGAHVLRTHIGGGQSIEEALRATLAELAMSERRRRA